MTVSDLTMDNINEENWALIPSDPAVFNDMIQQYGVRDTKVQELLTLDFEDIEKDQPVHGLMFVSPYVEERLPDNFEQPDPDAENVVFTAQILTNVCGTLALLAILFNADIQEKGELLDKFLDFTAGFSPINRGLCLGNSVEFRRIHDAYATAHHRAETAINDKASEATDDDGVEYISNDDYHYITYIYKNDYLWELDGLKYQPVKICKCTKKTWLEAAKPLLEQRMNASMTNEIAFSLMAVTHDPYNKLTQHRELFQDNIKKFGKVYHPVHPVQKRTINSYKSSFVKNTDSTVPHYAVLTKIWDELANGDLEKAKPNVEIIEGFFDKLQEDIKTSQENRKNSKNDATRQKADYFPFMQDTIKRCLESNTLDETILAPPSKKRKTSSSQKSNTQQKSITSTSTPNKKRRRNTRK